ncbi:hypothetical protein [Streptomyces sp. NPDC059168]|uniref:hypothetical protein n=1 Tax=Streptomyces sp. NPDC059168 TaxID=3346753 RepID=UPI0036AC25B0
MSSTWLPVMRRPAHDPTAVAVGLLVFGGGVLLLASLCGVWISFVAVVSISVGLAVIVEAQRRRNMRAEHEERQWKRIVWEEWGYRVE